MTISLHTQTSAPNAAAATSVSPLDPSGTTKTKFSKARTDIYQTVTDSIIAALESGVKPWSCPWLRVSGMSGLPSNYTTGAAYVNRPVLFPCIFLRYRPNNSAVDILPASYCSVIHAGVHSYILTPIFL